MSGATTTELQLAITKKGEITVRLKLTERVICFLTMLTIMAILNNAYAAGPGVSNIARTTAGTNLQANLSAVDMSNAYLSGTYVMTTFGGKQEFDGAVVDVWTDYVTLSFDGNGNGQIVEIDGDDELFSFTYSVKSDGEFTISIGEGGKGIVGSDGNLFTFTSKGANNTGGIDEVHYTGFKKSTGMSNASLSGTYVMTTFGGKQMADGSVADVWTDYVTLSFDGNGNGQIVEIDGDDELFSFTYSVSSDGKFTIAIGGEGKGIVSSDGNLFTFTTKGANNTGDIDEVRYTGTKTSAGMSNASLNGTYVMTTFGGKQMVDGSVADVWTDYVTLSFDGNGNGQVLEIDGDDELFSFTYSVNSDGKITISIGEGGKGIVGSDGNLFTFTTKGANDTGGMGIDEVHYTGFKKLYTAPEIRNAPSEPTMVYLTTPEKIAAAPVTSSYSGEKFNFVCNFPKYLTPVDLFIAYIAPDGNAYYPNSNGVLVKNLEAYKSNTIGGVSAAFTNNNEFQFVKGVWQVYWLLQPTGGDWSAYEFGGYQVTIE
ncbi:MAG: hypothetical protein JEZ12_23360 [Desulfobacterium sp.]|nr:hypothetical protein [Desulfobacterium sp.]